MLKKSSGADGTTEVAWQEERRTMTLEGEPVLEYSLYWPELRQTGWGGRWINQYYRRLARSWRLRWQREIYWKACLELAERRAASRPFTPWTGRLAGEVTLNRDGILSLRLEGEEVRGDGKPCRVQWGDTWKVREGAPCTLRDFFPGKGRPSRRLAAEISEQGRARRAAGDCFLDQDWERGVKRFLPEREFCVTPEGVEFAFPQCTIAPAAEGNPVFLLPVPEEAREQG